MNSVLQKYNSVRQKILLTENTGKTHMFYESCDFNPCDKYDLIAFTKIFRRYKESGKTIFSQTFLLNILSFNIKKSLQQSN